MFERALDALPDGVLLADAHRRILYCNLAFTKHWNIPAWALRALDEMVLLDLVREQLVDPAAFLREVERIHPTMEASEDELLLKDGRVLARRSVPFDESGSFAARLWIFTDVTEARHAHIDALSGLPNRRAYAGQFPRFVEAEADGMVRAVGLLDVDNFKAYNDRYGHAAGDVILRKIGSLLRRSLRAGDDLAFRIGGEEFLVASKWIDVQSALAFFEGLRAEIEEMQLPHEGNLPFKVVTASIGLTTFQKPGDPAQLVDQADAALYRAKREGRNSVVQAP
ncbi:sensor domain-containing diguanylate cyclase [Novosphingobium terrae]|uniref:sensor domain-containing diguanylate cyclase n=1 Tax=Novosphingobium terrae TaxID=2726189 RepID=UPI001981E3D7|nr:diguanylate cyclase [Novosphingobium terrae]